MPLLFAAAGAVAAALVELTLVPYGSVGGAAPHLVLVFVVLWTVIAGIEGGLVGAFLGGVALDVIVQRPLGSSAFALLVSVGLASLIAAVLVRARMVAPVIAVFACSLVYALLLYGTSVALLGPVRLGQPLATFLPDAVYDTLVAAIVGPLAVAIQLKRREAERVEW